MSNCAIVGINWGDEGKGRMVDLVTEQYDVVVRYQGGNNAGHTVINEYGKFALHLLPSGIFRKGVVNVLGNGVVIDCEHLWKEIEDLQKAGIEITPDNFKISDRATLVFPYHRDLDALEEARLKDRAYGSTKRGIAPVYSDKYQKKTIQAGELLYPEYLKGRLAGILEWKNLTIENVYHAKPYSLEDMFAWVMEYGSRLAPFICDAGAFLRQAEAQGKNILFEAQLGALRDLDFGIYPYTSSSNSIAAYAPVGAGIPGSRVDEVLGVVKAYSTCVGEGPFTCEWFGEEAEKLREAGGEYGAATGRPRRVGPLDLVATRYGVQLQGATNIALTKMDILSYLDKIPVCTHYDIDGTLTESFPFPALLDRAKPVYEYLPGWKCDISGVRKYEDLPQAARDYVEYVERAIGCRIGYVSVGAERDAIMTR
ncbi:MAG: adenylosuccinate synthase [Butyricicoccaceae bacterium]